MVFTTSQVCSPFPPFPPYSNHPPPSLPSTVSSPALTKFPIDFVDEHPGGAKILKRVAGKDATKQFWKYHNESVLKKYSEKLKIGTVGEKAKL